MGTNRKYPLEAAEKVIEYFKTHKDNTDEDIATALGYSTGWVSKTIREYYRNQQTKIDRINRNVN